MCECLMDGFISHQDKCPIDFSESGHLSFKEQVLAPSLSNNSNSNSYNNLLTVYRVYPCSVVLRLSCILLLLLLLLLSRLIYFNGNQFYLIVCPVALPLLLFALNREGRFPK